MPFSPGSTHQVTIPVANTGGADASGIGGTMNLSFGGTVLSLRLGLPSTLSAGGTAQWINTFTIPANAPVGTMATWALNMAYDSKVLSATGDAFMVEAGQILYPTDVFETWSLFGSQRFRNNDVAAGYLTNSGTGNANFLFPALPVFTVVTLVLYVVQVYQVQKASIVSNAIHYPDANGISSIYVQDTSVVPQVFRINVTSRASVGQAPWVYIVGHPPSATETGGATYAPDYYRAYGSINDGDPMRAVWPHLEIS